MLKNTLKLWIISCLPFFLGFMIEGCTATKTIVIQQNQGEHKGQTSPLSTLTPPVEGSQETVIPVLVYHNFRTNKPGPHHEMEISPRNFKKQLQYLKDNSFESVSLDVFLKSYHATLPKKPIIITIDDGYKSTYTLAFPLLKKMGYTATAFICPGVIGSPAFMTWKQCHEMSAAGFSIQSHTWTHPHLSQFLKNEPPEQYIIRVNKELTDSKNRIEKEVGRPVNHLAYPYGEYNEAVQQLALKAGYGTTSFATGGVNSFPADPLKIKRFVVTKDIPFRLFKDFLESLPLNARPINPKDGSFIADQSPILKALILDTSRIDPVSINLCLGDVPHPAVFNQFDNTIESKISFSARWGYHKAQITALDKVTKKTRSFNWVFGIKNKEKCEFYRKVKILLGIED